MMLRKLLLLPLASSFAAAASGSVPLDPPAAPGSMAPRIDVVRGGDPKIGPNEVVLSWLEPVPEASTPASGSKAMRLRMSFLRHGAWSEAQTVVERRDFFVNWADTPSVVRGRDARLYAHWLQMSADGTSTYDIAVARSEDDGATWTNLGPLHFDGVVAEYGFVSMVRDGAGVRAFWLDGRAMGPEAGPEADGHGHGGGGWRSPAMRGRPSPRRRSWLENRRWGAWTSR